MPITSDIQPLEPGAWVELSELDATSLGAEPYRFHGYWSEVIVGYWRHRDAKP